MKATGSLNEPVGMVKDRVCYAHLAAGSVQDDGCKHRTAAEEQESMGKSTAECQVNKYLKRQVHTPKPGITRMEKAVTNGIS